jgi:hypothetical protein
MKNLVVDNGKKTSGSTSTESVEQPGRGGGANGLQEKTDHGGRGHPGMLEQSTAVDGGAQDTSNLSLNLRDYIVDSMLLFNIWSKHSKLYIFMPTCLSELIFIFRYDVLLHMSDDIKIYS